MPSILKDVCRLCAKQNSVCVDVFGEEGVKNNVDLRVRLCTPIIIKEDEDMPKQVCLGCLDKLDKSYEFYMDCVSAQNIIKKMLGKRQTRSSAAGGSNASAGSGSCGLSNSLLARLNEGEVSLSDFLADDGESPAKKSRQENSSSIREPPAADPSQMEDIKPVPGVDIPDLNTLLRNSPANSLQQGTTSTIKARPESPVDNTQGPMVVITPSSIAAAAAVPIPSAPSSLPPSVPVLPPVAALTPTSASIPLSVPAPATTVSYVVNGIDSSALRSDSTLSNSAVIVQSAQENIYLSELSGVVTTPPLCAVTSAVREQNCEVIGNLTPQGVVRFEMRTGSPQLAFANIMQSSGPSLSTQPSVYVQDTNREFGSGGLFVVSQHSSSPARPTQTDPFISGLQSVVPSTVAYSRGNKSDAPRVVYSNRAAVSTSLTTSTKQLIPAVSVSSQPQQSLQLNEQSVISQSSQGGNTSVSPANNTRLVVVAASAPPTSTTSPKILKITQPKNQVQIQQQGGLQPNILNQQQTPQQQQHLTSNPVMPRVQLQQQLPLLKLPVFTPVSEQQQQPIQKQPQQTVSQQQPLQLQQLQQQVQPTLLKQQLQTPPLASKQASVACVAPITTAATVKTTSNTAQLSTPRRKENEPDQVCEHCQKSFPPDILIHHRVLHFRERFFSCISCGKNFRTEVGLDQHRCEVD